MRTSGDVQRQVQHALSERVSAGAEDGVQVAVLHEGRVVVDAEMRILSTLVEALVPTAWTACSVWPTRSQTRPVRPLEESAPAS